MRAARFCNFWSLVGRPWSCADARKTIECFHSRGQRLYANLLEQKKAFTWEKSSTSTGLVWDTNMAAVSLFWDTNMAAVTSCENTPYQYSVDTSWLKRHVMQRVSRYNSEHDFLWRTCESRTNNNIDWNLKERYWTVWSLFLSFKIWSFKSKSPGSEPESARSAFNWDMNWVIPGVI